MLFASVKTGGEEEAELVPVVVCALLGSEHSRIVYATGPVLKTIDFGNPPYCIVVPAVKLTTFETLLQFSVPEKVTKVSFENPPVPLSNSKIYPESAV